MPSQIPGSHRPLHIVFIDFDDIYNPLLNAGQARSTLEVGKRLVRMGHRITIISSKYPGSLDRIEEGLTYKHIGIGSKWIRLNNLGYNATLPFILRHLQADLILECFTPPCSTLLTPLMTRIPVVAKSTSFEAERLSQRYHLPFTWVEASGCRLYRYFIPSSPFAQAKMLSYNPGVVSQVIPEGVGEECFSVKRQANKHLLFLARLDMGQKGIDLLLQAYAKIKTQIPYPLVIAGHGPDEGKVIKAINALNLQDRVRLIGPTYKEKKRAVLSGAVSVTISSRYEGFCLFALEALAAGVPLVTFDIPGLSWISPRVALKAQSFNVDQYAQQLLEICKPEINSQLSKAAKRFAKTYTWDQVALQYNHFFQMVIYAESLQNQGALAVPVAGKEKLAI